MSLEQASETDLVVLAGAGDAEAFATLIKPHLGMFYNAILRILGEPADAQDALQNALIAIHKDLPGFQGRSRFSSWGYTVCIHSALTLRRSRVQRREDPLETFASHEDPGERPRDVEPASDSHVEPEAFHRLEREEMRTRMMNALDCLPDGQRVVFVLHDLEDWSNEEIGSHLGITPALVRQRLHRARMYLQERLRDQLTGRRP